jgi:hypothetical protein
MSKLLRPLLGITAGLVLTFTLFHANSFEVFAQTSGLGNDPSIQPSALTQATGGETSLIGLVRTMLNYLLSFLAILCIAIIIYGGFQYVTAGVNEAGAETGKKILMYAAIGVIVILLSFVIVNALLSAALPGPAQ